MTASPVSSTVSSTGKVVKDYGWMNEATELNFPESHPKDDESGPRRGDSLRKGPEEEMNLMPLGLKDGGYWECSWGPILSAVAYVSPGICLWGGEGSGDSVHVNGLTAFCQR